MNLDDALGAQTRIATKILNHQELAVAHDGDGPPYPAFALPDLMQSSSPDLAAPGMSAKAINDAFGKLPARLLIGTGVSPMNPDNREEDGFSVVLFCQREKDLESAEVRQARNLLGNDVRAEYVGVVQSGQPAAPTLGGGSPPPTTTRTVRIGDNAAHHLVSDGTIGGFVRLAGADFMLSANHVFANLFTGAATLTGDIISPSSHRGGQLANRIAAVTQAHALNLFGAPNLADCALATLDPAIGFDRYGLHGIPGLPMAQLNPTPIPTTPFLPVAKLGAATGHTSGSVSRINVNILTLMQGVTPVFFTNQVFISGTTAPFSSGGDSGSLVFDQLTFRPTAMVIGGTSRGAAAKFGHTLATPIALVLSALGNCAF